MSTFGTGMSAVNYYIALNALKASNCIIVKSSESSIGSADYVCDGTADEVEINAAITAMNALTQGGTVKLTDGKFYLSSRIIMKSNVHLELNDSSYMFLINGANEYMVVNGNLAYTGNTNHFSVRGGIWDGNDANQTALGDGNTGTPSSHCWQHVMCFVSASDYYVGDLTIKHGVYWAIGNFWSTRCIYNNMAIWQRAYTHNSFHYGDYMDSWWCQDMIINNMRGFSNDSMLNITSSPDWYTTGVVAQHWGAPRISKNIYISNITVMQDPTTGMYPESVVYLDALGGETIENVVIDGIRAQWDNDTLPAIWMMNFGTTVSGSTGYQGKIKNISIKNLDLILRGSAQSVLALGDCGHATNTYTNLSVENISFQNINVTNSENTKKTMFALGDMCKSINIQNIKVKNSTGTTQHDLMTVSPTSVAGTINVQGVDITGDIVPIIKNAGTSTGLRVNAPECYADVLAQVNAAVIGDRMIEKTSKHPILYTTKWIDVVTGADI